MCNPYQYSSWISSGRASSQTFPSAIALALFVVTLLVGPAATSAQQQPELRPAKPRIAVFSGATATVANTEPLVTSNKARAKYGLPLPRKPERSIVRFDVLRPQRLARPVIVYVEQFTAHPLERDAAELSAPPDGYWDTQGVFHLTRTSPSDVPVYEVTLHPDDGLYLLPYMARQANGQA